MSLPAGARSGCGAWPWAVAACRECRDWAPPGASSPAQARGGLPGGEGQGAGGGAAAAPHAHADADKV